MRYACYKLKYKGGCSLLAVHICKNSVCYRFKKIIAIVGIVIRYGIDDHAEYGIRKTFTSGACFTESVLQLFDYLNFIFRFDMPKPERSVMARIGVGHVEQILQPRFVAAVVNNGNTLGVFIDPAPEPAVPKLHWRACSSIRTLGMDEHLLMERIFVEPRGGVEEAFPVVNGLGKLLCGLRRKLRHDMKFCRQF